MVAKEGFFGRFDGAQSTTEGRGRDRGGGREAEHGRGGPQGRDRLQRRTVIWPAYEQGWATPLLQPGARNERAGGLCTRQRRGQARAHTPNAAQTNMKCTGVMDA
jgi:hypothetical protein